MWPVMAIVRQCNVSLGPCHSLWIGRWSSGVTRWEPMPCSIAGSAVRWVWSWHTSPDGAGVPRIFQCPVPCRISYAAPQSATLQCAVRGHEMIAIESFKGNLGSRHWTLSLTYYVDNMVYCKGIMGIWMWALRLLVQLKFIHCKQQVIFSNDITTNDCKMFGLLYLHLTVWHR